MHQGYKYQENINLVDEATGRQVLQLTRSGNSQTTGYHAATGFTSDSAYVVFFMENEQGMFVVRGEVATGELCLVHKIRDSGSRGWEPLVHYSSPLYMSTIPDRSTVAISDNATLKLLDIFSFESRILYSIPEGRRISQPMASHDGRYIYFCEMPLRPETADENVGSSPEMFWKPFMDKYGGMPSWLYRLALDTGEVEELYHDPVNCSHHIHTSPTDADLVLVELDRPPLFAWGGDRASARAHILDARTRKLTELAPRNERKFQSHTIWSCDGEYVYYHGRDHKTGNAIGQPGGGHYIGAINKSGEVRWERVFPHWHYGHVGMHTKRNAVIIDGLLTSDYLLEIDFMEAGDSGIPRLELLGRHGSTIMPSRQHSHPHLQMSPDGKWIMFNRYNGEDTQVMLLRM